MDIITTAALCITVCIITQVLRDSGEMKLALIILCVTVVFMSLTSQLLGVRELVGELLDKTGLDEAYLRMIFKGLGICYITVISADICRDSGQSALAAQIEIAGKLAMTVTALPLFRAVTEIVEGMLT
ncbi:MAG: hypothetical protein IKN17_11330 [Ruminococcus sp.]|nr:hypothetical protein [Ruminococcus sp.]